MYYPEPSDNTGLTSAEDGSFAGMLVVLPQGPGPRQGLRLLRPGRLQGQERVELAWPGAEPWLETGC